MLLEGPEHGSGLSAFQDAVVEGNRGDIVEERILITQAMLER